MVVNVGDILLSVKEVVIDCLASVDPDPDLRLQIAEGLDLVPEEVLVLDVGGVPPGVSGEVCAGGDLLLLPGRQRHLDPDEAALPELPHEVVSPLPGPASPEEGMYLEGHEEVTGLPEIFQALLLVSHGAVDDHVQEHLLILGMAEAQHEVVVVTIFGKSIT